MEPDEARIAEHVRENPPACVAGFRLVPAELPEPFDDGFQTVYRLVCRCGHDRGAVLGYPLSDCNPDYEGPEFVTPLSFACHACGAVTPIVDTDEHGYHAEVGKLEGEPGSAKLRGEGEPVPFACPECSATIFAVTVAFVYWDFDLALDEPELPAQEFFHAFVIQAACEGCGKVSAVADLGKL